MRVTMTHVDLPGVAVDVAQNSYRYAWWPEGWRSADDPEWNGPPGHTPSSTLSSHVAASLGAGAHGTIAPDLHAQTPADWDEIIFSTDPSAIAATALTFEHGQAVMRGSGAGTGVRSGRRSVFVIPGSTRGYSRIRSRFCGRPPATALVPQHGHMHGVGVQADGKLRGVIVWHDIVFSAPYVFNLGLWEADPGGANFVAGALLGTTAVSAGARSSNVVTLTVPTGHGFKTGDLIKVDMSDDTYDGIFPVASTPTATTITYAQTAANDASAGTGTIILARNDLFKSQLIRTMTISDAARASGVVTATVTAGHGFAVGDWVKVDLTDNTYDGQFVIHEVTDATHVKWRQVASDDASSGAGTATKDLPYWLESEWLPNGIIRARVWPDVAPPGAPAGPPPWNSPWGMTYQLLDPSVIDPDAGEGCALLAGHLAAGSTITEVRYDAVETSRISATLDA